MNRPDTTIHVNAEWDPQALVWTATSEDLPGLVTEAATLDALLERISEIAPELLADSPVIHSNPQVSTPHESAGLRIMLHADRQMVLSA